MDDETRKALTVHKSLEFCRMMAMAPDEVQQPTLEALRTPIQRKDSTPIQAMVDDTLDLFSLSLADALEELWDGMEDAYRVHTEMN